MREQGWTYKKTTKGHVIFLNEQGQPVGGMGGALGDRRAPKNIRATLKRNGLRI